MLPRVNFPEGVPGDRYARHGSSLLMLMEGAVRRKSSASDESADTPSTEVPMCNACDDEKGDRSTIGYQWVREMPVARIFATGSQSTAKHYRTPLRDLALQLYKRFSRHGAAPGRRKDITREVAFYRGGRCPETTRVPEEILVSFDAIVEIHKRRAIPRKRAK
jgi:hypothetical protein